MRRRTSLTAALSASFLLIGLLVAPGASAIFALEERTVPSRTTTFRALAITDVNGIDDTIGISGVPSFDTPKMLIQTRSGLANVPPGCESLPQTPEGVTFGIVCPVGNYDLISIETGAGDDSVGVGFEHPSLTRHQIDSPNTAVYVNATLGDGADKFKSPITGTDFVHTGSGKDLVKAGPSNDLVFGAGGADRLLGEGGLDQLLGAKGPDRLSGGPGAPDLHVGGRGRDRCIGQPRDLAASCERIRVVR